MFLQGQIAKNSHVLHSISNLEEKQTGQHYSEMVECLIAEENIKRVTVFVTDELQRFRLMFLNTTKKDTCLTEEEARTLALEYGQKWLDENSQAIEQLKQHKEVTIIRWKDYENTEKFNDALTTVKILNERDNQYRHAVNGLVANFTTKMLGHLKEKNPQHQFSRKQINEAMRNYVLHECALVIAAGNDDAANYDYELYFGKRNRAMQHVARNYIPAGRLKENQIISGDAPKKKPVDDHQPFIPAFKMLTESYLSDISRNEELFLQYYKQLLFNIILETVKTADTDNKPDPQIVKKKLSDIRKRVDSASRFFNQDVQQRNADRKSLLIETLCQPLVQTLKFLNFSLQEDDGQLTTELKLCKLYANLLVGINSYNYNDQIPPRKLPQDELHVKKTGLSIY